MTLVKGSNIDRVLSAFTSGYPCFHEFKDRLFFTEEARGVLGSILGFISGLWMAGQHEKAVAFADDFMKWMEYLCPLHMADLYQPDSYGSHNRKVPGRVCELHADGTMMGFSLAWYILLQDQQQPVGHRIRQFGIWDAKYAYQMNGGLLFHGSTQEVFAVSLSNTSLWGIHT